MEISNYILRISGKAELPREIAIGSNYHISLEGAVTNFTEADLENGYHSRTYTFKPVKLELLDPIGETLKLKDARKKSQMFRARLFAIWREQNVAFPFEEWYDRTMSALIQDAENISEIYSPK